MIFVVIYIILDSRWWGNPCINILFAILRERTAFMKKSVFTVSSFRKLPNPYPDALEEAAHMYFAVCDVTEIPDDFPMQTNPRDQNLGTGVAKKIRKSLEAEAEKNFYLLNRGVVLSAKEVVYNNAKNELTIVFEDEDVHGNIDGGHTYKIIKELKNRITSGSQYVKIEILTGVEDIFSQLAAARNTSVQVQDKSIAELEDRFDIIKNVLQNEPKVMDRVIYKQNADGDIDISEILSILNLFNLDEYPNNQTESYPIQSYSGKAKCTERYIKLHKEHAESIENPYVKMTPIIIDAFKLYNRLETKISDYYAQGNQGGRYGRIKGVSGGNGEGKHTSKFYLQSMDYSTPTGFIYPILGAFRALLSVNQDGYYYWVSDPFAIMDILGKELVCTTVDRSRTLGNNPQSVGKDRGHWRTLYITAKMYVLENVGLTADSTNLSKGD